MEQEENRPGKELRLGKNTYFIPSGRRQKLQIGVWKAWTSQVASSWVIATKLYLGNSEGTEKLGVTS